MIKQDVLLHTGGIMSAEVRARQVAELFCLGEGPEVKKNNTLPKMKRIQARKKRWRHRLKAVNQVHAIAPPPIGLTPNFMAVDTLDMFQERTSPPWNGGTKPGQGSLPMWMDTKGIFSMTLKPPPSAWRWLLSIGSWKESHSTTKEWQGKSVSMSCPTCDVPS